MTTIAAILRYTTVPIVPSVDGLLPTDLPQHNSIKLTFSSYTTGADLLQNLDALIVQKLPGRVRDSPSELLYYPPSAAAASPTTISNSAYISETESHKGDNKSSNKRPQQHVSSSSSVSSPSPSPVVIPLGAVLLDEPQIAERYHASLVPAVSGVPPTREQPIVFVVRRVRSQPRIKVAATVGGDGNRSSTATGASTLLSPATAADQLVAQTMAEMRAGAAMATIARIEAKNSNAGGDTDGGKGDGGDKGVGGDDGDGDKGVGEDRYSHSVPWMDRLKAFPNAAHLTDTLENEEEALGAYLRIVERQNAELKARRTAVRERAVAVKRDMALHQKIIADHTAEVSEKASLNEAVERLRLELEIQEKRRGELMNQLLLTRSSNNNSNRNDFVSSGMSSPLPRRGLRMGAEDDDVLNSPSPLPPASPTATALAEGGPLLKQLLAEQQQRIINNDNTANTKELVSEAHAEKNNSTNNTLARTTSADASTAKSRTTADEEAAQNREGAAPATLGRAANVPYSSGVGVGSDPAYDDALRKIQARMGLEGGIIANSSHHHNNNTRPSNMPSEHGRRQPEREASRFEGTHPRLIDTNSHSEETVGGNSYTNNGPTRGGLEGIPEAYHSGQRREGGRSGSSVSGARREERERGVSHHHDQHHHHERFSQSPTSLASPVVDRRTQHPLPTYSHQQGGHQQHHQRENFFGGGGTSVAVRRSGGYNYRDDHHQNPPPPPNVMFEELAEVDDDSWLLSPDLAREVAEVLDRPSPQPSTSTKVSALPLPRYLTAVKDRYTELNPESSAYGYGPRADALRPTAAALASDLGAYRKRLEQSAQALAPHHPNVPHAYNPNHAVSDLLASTDRAAYFTSAGLPPVPLPPPPHHNQHQQPSPSSYGMSRRGEELMAALEGRRAMAVQQPFYPSNPDPPSTYARTYEAASIATMSAPAHARAHHHDPHAAYHHGQGQFYEGGMNASHSSYAHINDSRAHRQNLYPMHPQHSNVRAHYADNSSDREGPVVGGPAGYRPTAPASWQ